jgi:hypothetical protein
LKRPITLVVDGVQADLTVEPVPEAKISLFHIGDLGLVELDFCCRRFNNFDLGGTSARRGWGGEAAGIDEAVLGFDAEELLAFNVIDFAPVDGDSTGSVVEADGKSIGTETLDFASEAVAIAHNEDVGLFASGKSLDKQKQETQAEYSRVKFHERELLELCNRASGVRD